MNYKITQKILSWLVSLREKVWKKERLRLLKRKWRLGGGIGQFKGKKGYCATVP